MQLKRWKVVAFTAVVGVVFAACEDIIVEVIDRSAPELGLAYTGTTPARFPDGTTVTVDRPVMPGGAFIIEPARSTETMNFIPVARDRESAIRSQDATVEFTFTCTALVPGGYVSKTARASFHGSQFTPDVDGEETKDTEGFVIGMTTTDLWKRGGCENWGQIINVRHGIIRGVRGIVRASALNNAQPALRGTFEATFTNPATYSISY